jgi:hypothetical protein
VITGANIIARDTSPIDVPFFYLQARPARAADRPGPDGTFQFLKPRVVVDGEGVIHLVWGETAEPVKTLLETLSPRITDLWYASLRGNEWSPAEKLHHAYDIRWDKHSAAVMLGDDGQSITLMFGARSWNQDGGLRTETMRLTRRPGGTLIRNSVLSKIDPLYLSGARQGGEWVTAYVAWHPEFGSNTLHIISSPDGDRWSDPTVLSTGPGNVYNVWLFVDSEDATHIVWFHADGNGALGDYVLRHSYRDNAEEDWTESEPLVLPPGVNRGTAAMDACDQIHIVAEVADQGPTPRLLRYRFGSGEWSEESVPSGGSLALEPVLASEGDGGSLYLAWTQAVQDSMDEEGSLRVWLSRLALGEHE